MSAIPPEVERLARERDEARRARDFARADALREEIARLGFDVRDSSGTSEVMARARRAAVDPSEIRSTLDEPATTEFSVHVLYDGFPEDLERFLGAIEKTSPGGDYEAIVVDDASGDGETLEEIVAAHPRARLLSLARAVGWAAARNAGLGTSRGRILALADLSVEPLGDVLSPLAAALADPGVGVAGPFGLVSDDLREFVPSTGPEVDAVEGYLLAARREVFARHLLDERFRWYRHADLDLSFRIRDGGLEAVVVPCPVARHAHRGWEALGEAERARLSKRNYYRFLDRWRNRRDLLVSCRRG